MSTNHTPNLNLSQWVRSDQVLMDDFNADNAKIDTALRDMRPYLIRSWVTEEDAARMELDISDIQWTQYSWVIVDIVFPTWVSYYLDVGGSDFSHSGNSSNGNFAHSVHPTGICTILLPVFHRDDVCMTNIALSRGGSMGGTSTQYRHATAMTLGVLSTSTTDEYIRAGTKIKIWAMK